jgi:hypothetical protein
MVTSLLYSDRNLGWDDMTVEKISWYKKNIPLNVCDTGYIILNGYSSSGISNDQIPSTMQQMCHSIDFLDAIP